MSENIIRKSEKSFHKSCFWPYRLCVLKQRVEVGYHVYILGVPSWEISLVCDADPSETSMPMSRIPSLIGSKLSPRRYLKNCFDGESSGRMLIGKDVALERWVFAWWWSRSFKAGRFHKAADDNIPSIGTPQGLSAKGIWLLFQGGHLALRAIGWISDTGRSVSNILTSQVQWQQASCPTPTLQYVPATPWLRLSSHHQWCPVQWWKDS